MTENTKVSPKLLEQALKSCDEALIRFVLDKTVEDQIPAYIQPIPPNLLATFLRSFNKFLISEPQYLKTILPWIENLIEIHQLSISASGECQRKLSELQHTLKQRTQQIGQFVEAYAVTQFVLHEREGQGVGLPINDEDMQSLNEDE